MTPGIVHVKLHPVPGFLAEIDLERVVGSITGVGLETSCLTCVVRIRLEKVDGIARSGDSCAGREVGAAYQVAEVGRAAGHGAGESAGSAGVEIRNKRAIGKEGCVSPGSGG